MVAAFDGTSESASSTEAAAAPLNDPPVRPTNFTATDRPNDAGGAVDLTWNLSTSTDVTEQRLYRTTSAGIYASPFQTFSSTTSSYTDTGLTDGVTYFYVVTAFDGTSESASSTEATAVPLDDQPAVPTSLTATDRPNDQGGTVDLAWTPSASGDVTEQRLYRRTASTSYSGPVQTFSSTTSAFADTGLDSATTFFYVVTAFDGTNESASSNEVFATPVDNLEPAAPTGLTATDAINDRGGAVSASWTPSASSDVIEQRVYRATTPGGYTAAVHTFFDNTTGSYTDTDLTDGVTYYYVVRAFDGTSESANSTESAAIPLDDLALAIPGASPWTLAALAAALGLLTLRGRRLRKAQMSG